MHRYVISYTIPGALSPAGAGAADEFLTSTGADASPAESVFLWSVVASGWDLRIDRAVVQVTLPAPSGRVQCEVADPEARSPAPSGGLARAG